MTGEASPRPHRQQRGPHVNSDAAVLLPIWIVGCRYNAARFPLISNGHTGAGHGTVPRRRVQGWLARSPGLDTNNAES